MKTIATRTFLAGAMAVLLSLPAQAQEVRISLLAGMTGPISAMAPDMVAASRLAFEQVNTQGGLGEANMRIRTTVNDSACNPQNATDAATKAVNIDRAFAIIGPHCSGALLAAVNSVTIPAGVLTISPSATSPQLTTLDDRDLVFRTVPSDAFQGQALARVLIERGTDEVAVAYLNNDYGQGLARAFREKFEALGGTLAGFASHDGGRASYRAELAQLARQGADTLVVFDYGDSSGLTLIRQAIENGFFTHFIGADGMRSDALIRLLGAENLDTLLVSAPIGDTSEAQDRFREASLEAGNNPDGIFASNAYDAAFLLAMAIEHARGEREQLPQSLRNVAGPPGEKIYPGQWEKAKQLIAAGEEVDYVGAAGSMDFDEAGDVPGVYALFEVRDDTFMALIEIE